MEDEWMSQLRQHGIADLHEVNHGYVEPDGQISMVKKSSDSGSDDLSGKEKKHTRVSRAPPKFGFAAEPI